MKKLKAAEVRNDSEFSYRANDFNIEDYDFDEIDIESGWMGVENLPLKVIGDDYGMYQTVHSDKDGNYLFRAYNNTDDEIAANFYNKYFSDEYGNYIFEIYYDKIEEKANEGDKEAQDILNGKWDRNLHEYFANEVYSPEQEWEIMSNFMNRFENENKMNIKKAGNYTIFNMTDLLGELTMKESKTKRTIKEYVEPKTFEDKALFDDFKDSIGGRCFNKDSVYRWVYELTDIKPTDDEIYEIMDEWVKNKWVYKKENERTGANFYYFDLKETVSESKKILKEGGFERGISDQLEMVLDYIDAQNPKNKKDVEKALNSYIDNGNINDKDFIKSIRDIIRYSYTDYYSYISREEYEKVHEIVYDIIVSDILPEIEKDKSYIKSFSEDEQKLLKYIMKNKNHKNHKDSSWIIGRTIWNFWHFDKVFNIWKYFVADDEFNKILKDVFVPFAVDMYEKRYIEKSITEGRKNMKRIIRESRYDEKWNDLQKELYNSLNNLFKEYDTDFNESIKDFMERKANEYYTYDSPFRKLKPIEFLEVKDCFMRKMLYGKY